MKFLLQSLFVLMMFLTLAACDCLLYNNEQIAREILLGQSLDSGTTDYYKRNADEIDKLVKQSSIAFKLLTHCELTDEELSLYKSEIDDINRIMGKWTTEAMMAYELSHGLPLCDVDKSYYETTKKEIDYMVALLKNKAGNMSPPTTVSSRPIVQEPDQLPGIDEPPSQNLDNSDIPAVPEIND
jgi:hypothetical protein